MADILIKASGFVLIIVVAYIFKMLKIFKVEDKNFLGSILININLPCVIISGIKDFKYDNSLVFAVVMGIVVSLVGIGVGYLVSLKKSKDAKILHMMSSTGYNIGIFTIPFVSSFLTSTALICTMMFDIGNAIMVFGTSAAITSSIVTKSKSNPAPAILKKLITTTPFVVYLLMLILLGLNVPIPDAVYTVTDIGADATAFLAMIMIGIMIDLKIRMSEFKEVFSAIVVRYVFTTIVAIIVYFLPFPLEVRKALIIGVFSPLSTASVVFTQKLGCKPSLVGVFSSICIIISMTAIVGIVIFI